MRTSVTAKQLREIPAVLLAITEYHLADKPCGDRPEARDIETIENEYRPKKAVTSIGWMALFEE